MVTKSATTATTKSLPCMTEVITALRTVMNRGEVELNCLEILFAIAAQPRPIPQIHLRDVSGLSEAAVSRNLAILGEGSSFRTPGPKLVETYEDPDYRRRKLVRLTAKGRSFMDTIQLIFDKHTSTTGGK